MTCSSSRRILRISADVRQLEEAGRARVFSMRKDVFVWHTDNVSRTFRRTSKRSVFFMLFGGANTHPLCMSLFFTFDKLGLMSL